MSEGASLPIQIRLTPKPRYISQWHSVSYNFSFWLSVESSSAISQKARNLCCPRFWEKGCELGFLKIMSLYFSYSLLSLTVHLTIAYRSLQSHRQAREEIVCNQHGHFVHSLTPALGFSLNTHFYLVNSPCLDPKLPPPLSSLKGWKLKNTFLWNE